MFRYFTKINSAKYLPIRNYSGNIAGSSLSHVFINPGIYSMLRKLFLIIGSSIRLHYVLYLLIILLLANSCNNNPDNAGDRDRDKNILRVPQLERDLSHIREDGTLNAITIYSGTSYFLYRGQAMGFEYDLLERYAEHLGLELNIIIAKNQDELINMLNRGEGDIIAHGLTITKSRKKYVSFTEHHYLTHQALVQRKPVNWRKMKLHEIDESLIKDPVELIGDTVSVRYNSSYYQRLQNLSAEIGGQIYIDTLPGNLPTDEIIKMVVDEKIHYTVADYNIAAINKAYYPILDISTEISFSQRIAWAVRKNSPDLLKNLSKWIKEFKRESEYYVIYNKYFKDSRKIRSRARSEYHSKNTGKISKYDEIVKEYAAKIGWDWRLLISLIYQESRFKPRAKSWAGSRGLMQLTGVTAKAMNVKNIYDPEDNIRGGTKYLRQLWEYWKEVPDSIQRIKFTLASYNCGYNHVNDAVRLAMKEDDNHLVWDDNVEDYILKLSYPEYYNQEIVKYGFVRGQEPYDYVNEILKRYEQYKQFIPLGPGQAKMIQ
jgi:membrane-bound lytic murein transglycosylase F